MDKERVIAVTGTPGTGKSTFARELADDLNYRLVDLNEIIEREELYEAEEGGMKLVDPEDLEGIDQYIDVQGEGVVVDGLLSYLISPEWITHVVVLRTAPDTLKGRLMGRGYSDDKLHENLEAEALGVVLGRAIERYGTERVYEIDTTDLEPSEAVDAFREALEGERTLEPGSVDWLGDYFSEWENKL